MEDAEILTALRALVALQAVPSRARVLQEACAYIARLQYSVNEMSAKLRALQPELEGIVVAAPHGCITPDKCAGHGYCKQDPCCFN